MKAVFVRHLARVSAICAASLVAWLPLAFADNYDDGLYALQQNQPRQARQFFQRAAEAGDAGAAYALWQLHQQGIGGETDLKQGLQWLLVAAYKKLPQAQFELGEYYDAHREIAHAAENARYWWQAAASDKQPLAYFRLAQAYEQGVGGKTDYHQAQVFFARALDNFLVHAEKGNAEAQFYLAMCFEQGKGTAQNWGKALAWYKKAGMNGYTPGLTQSGRLLMLQARTESQLREAAYWLQLAQDRGSKLAQSLLSQVQTLEAQAVANR